MEQGVGLPAFDSTVNLSTGDADIITEGGDTIVVTDDIADTRESDKPQIMLQVSRDGGFTYGNEMWIKMGALGQYLRRAEWRRLGVSRSFVFKFRITDPIKVVLIGAAAYITQAAK
jgi:hypothetical protein